MATEQSSFNFDVAPASGPVDPKNPLGVGPAPEEFPTIKKNPFDDFMERSHKEALQSYVPDTGQVGKTGYHNADSYDIFAAQDNFNPQGFDPSDYKGNYERQADLTTWGDTFGKAFSDFGYKFTNSFGEYWSSYGRLAEAVFTADMSKMDLSEEEKIFQYYQDNLNENRNHLFLKDADKDDFFNKQFVKDLVGNSGFALGTFAGVAVELAADMLITVASGGSAAPATIASGASALARAGNAARKLGKGFMMGNKAVEEIRVADHILDTADAVRNISSATNRATSAGRQAMKATFDNLAIDLTNMKKINSVMSAAAWTLKEIPVLGTAVRHGEKAYAAAKAGHGIAELAGISLRGIHRSMAELNMAASEAAFESVSTYGDTLDRMLQDYQQQHGTMPSGEELLKMREMAVKASSANYNSNLGILLLSNKLQFGNMFSKYLPANRLVREFTEDASDHLFTVAAKGQTRVFEKGLFGTYGAAGKIAKEFGGKAAGRKIALREMSKAFIKDFGKFEVSEGIQENMQETSAHGWRDFYASAYSGNPKSLAHAMGEGAREQFTQQGLKTFMMGALTGSIIRVPTIAAQKALQKMQDFSYNIQGKNNLSPDQNYRRQIKEHINTLNAFYAMPSNKIFNEKTFNFKAQQQASAEMTQAAAEGKVYEFVNAQENAALAAAKAALATNTIDALTDQVRQMGKAFDEQAFKEAFGIDIKDTGYSSVEQFTNKVADDIKLYADTIQDVKRKFGPMVDPMIYKAGTKSRYAAAFWAGSVDAMAEVVALNKIKGNMTAERVRKLTGEIMAIPGLANSADYALRTLTNGKVTASEIGHARLELELLSKSLGEVTDDKVKADLRKQIENKQKEIELLTKWDRLFTSGYDTITGEDGKETSIEVHRQFRGENTEEVRDLFQQVLNLKNKQAGVDAQVSMEDLTDSFEKIIDYIKLDQDGRDYMEAVDMFTDPKKFMEEFTRLNDGKFKAGVLNYLDSVMHIVRSSLDGKLAELDTSKKVAGADLIRITRSMIETLMDSEHYRNMLTLVHNGKLGVEHGEYFQKLMKGLEEDLDAKAAELIGETLKPAAPQVAATEPEPENPGAAPEPEPENPGAAPAPGPAPEAPPAGAAPGASPAPAATTYPSKEHELHDVVQFTNGKWGPLAFDMSAATADSRKEAYEQVEARWAGTAVAAEPEAEGVYGTGSVVELSPTVSGRHPVAEPEGGFAEDPSTEDNTPAFAVGDEFFWKTATFTVNAINGSDVHLSSLLAGDQVLSATALLAKLQSGEIVRQSKQVASPQPVAEEVSLQGIIPTPPGEEAVVPGASVSEDEKVDDSQVTAALMGNSGLVPEVPFTNTEGTITDRSGNVVAEELEEKEAEELVTSLNNTRATIDFSVSEFTQAFEGDTELISDFISRAERAMKAFNKKHGTDFQNVEEFAQTPKGLTSLKKIRDNVLKTAQAETTETEETVSETPVEEVVLPTGTTSGQMTIRFDSTPVADAVGLSPDILENLHNKIVEISKSDLQNSGKNGNFVKSSGVSQQVITEESIFDFLRDEILGCNK